jgi:hypothetical protein
MKKNLFEKIKLIKDRLVSLMFKLYSKLLLFLILSLILEVQLFISIVAYHVYKEGWHFVYNFKTYIYALIIVFFTNIIIHRILDCLLFEPVYEEKYLKWLKTHDVSIFIILSLGFFNTYMLALYYRKHEHSRDFLLYQDRSFGDAMERWPIINIFTYIRIMRRLTKKYPELTWRFMWKLYFQGRLISYLVKNDYPYPKNE